MIICNFVYKFTAECEVVCELMAGQGIEPSMLQLITPSGHIISGLPGGWHNPSCCQIEGLYTSLNVAE